MKAHHQFLVVLGTLLLTVVSSIASAQQQKGFVEKNQAANENEVITKVEVQLLGALELLQAMQQENGEVMPPQILPKFTEKRRNKFEFIRFGRRR